MKNLYDVIKDDIFLIQQAKGDKDFKSLIELSLAYSRVNNLLNLINEKYKEISPNLIHEDLSIKNINELRDRLDEAENFLNDNNAYDEIIAKQMNFKTPDISNVGSEELDEYTSFTIVLNSLIEGVKLYDKNNLNKEDNAISPKELILSARDEIDRLFSKDVIKVEIHEDLDREFEIINDFISKPAKTIFSLGGNNLLKFKNQKEKNDFIKDIDSNVLISKREYKESEKSLAIEAGAVNSLNGNGSYDVEALATSLKKIIVDYYNESNKAKIEKPLLGQKYPPMGKILYSLKEKLTQIVIKDNVELGIDRYSTFIKNYLNDPIDCMNEYLEDKLEDYRIRDINKKITLISEDDHIDFENRIKRVTDFKNEINDNRNAYSLYALDKKDSWKEEQDYRAKWFINHFKDKMDNLMIDEVLKKNKGGFFENLFGTTSKEYKDFSNRLDNFMKDGTFKGDLDGLKESANIYLSHKLSSYEWLSKGYDDSEILELDSTSKGRVLLALAVVDAVDEAKEAVNFRKDLNEFKPDDKFEFDMNNYLKELKNINMKNKELNDFQDNLEKETSPMFTPKGIEKNADVKYMEKDDVSEDLEDDFLFDNKSI